MPVEQQEAEEKQKTNKKKEQQKYTELDHTAVCCGWEKKKKSDVSKERRMAGDTWSKSRSEDPEAVADTQTHNNHVTAALYTEIHTAVRGRRRSFTKHHHHPFPRVSLTPFLPHTHTHTHTIQSLSHTHTHKYSCQEAACCPWGLWRIITQQSRLKSWEWTSFSNAQCSSSPRHQALLNRGPNRSGKLRCVFSNELGVVFSEQEQNRNCWPSCQRPALGSQVTE